MTQAPHGTISRRKHGKCGCEPCMEAGRRYARHRHRQQAYGAWKPFVDATATRAHIELLRRAGLGWTRIAALAGVPASTVERILFGRPGAGEPPTRRIRPATEAKFLALAPSPAFFPDRGLVDGTGTRRRLQALCAMGWTARVIGPRMGVNPSYLTELLRCDKVQRVTAERVRDLFEDLSNRSPGDHGISPAQELRARRAAAKNGWLLPSVWDGDIDDPSCDPTVLGDSLDPVLIDRLVRGVPATVDRQHRKAVAQVLLQEHQFTSGAVASSLGVSERTVERWKAEGHWLRAA